MTTSLATSPLSFICLQHVWTFSSSKDTLFLSEFIGIEGMAVEKAFRFGVETDRSGYLVKVCCYVNSAELSRFGITVKKVTCSVKEQEGSSNPTGLLLCNLENVDKNDGNNAVLFVRLLESQYFYKPCLTFRLNLSELVEQYAPSRFDVNIGQQLWDAAVNEQLTDAAFQVGNSTFPAHKFILAARSPVFRAMFDADMVESQTGKVQITDAGPEIFGQFLHFLYTGQLVKPLCLQLEMVAEKYQVETLASLCRDYVHAIEASRDDMLKSITMSKQKLKRLETKKNLKSCQPPDVNEKSKADLLHTEVYTVKEIITDALTLAKGLRLTIELVGREYVVTLYSRWSNALRVANVDLFVDHGETVVSQHSMEPLIPSKDLHKQPLQFFRSTGIVVPQQQPAHTFRFVVRYVSMVDSFLYQLRDSLFPQELWSSAVNKDKADVEFQVGGRTFPAHRAILNARCPALAALIPAESSPSFLSTVAILDMDPIVFEDVLYFLYTGSTRDHDKTLEPKHQKRLSDAARNYQIQTLSGVMEQKVDHDELSEILMTIF